MTSILDLVRSGDIHPVIGSVVTFDELPAAIDAMGKRQTTGRTIAMV